MVNPTPDVIKTIVNEVKNWSKMAIDILNTLDSASLLVELKPRIFQRFPPFE
jgi:hypothetical protein